MRSSLGQGELDSKALLDAPRGVILQVNHPMAGVSLGSGHGSAHASVCCGSVPTPLLLGLLFQGQFTCSDGRFGD